MSSFLLSLLAKLPKEFESNHFLIATTHINQKGMIKVLEFISTVEGKKPEGLTHT
jgi:hypothetical protein